MVSEHGWRRVWSVVAGVFCEGDMTESEWLASDDPAAMLRLFDDRNAKIWPLNLPWPLISDRQKRLWVEACRAMANVDWGLLPDIALGSTVLYWATAIDCVESMSVPLTMRAHLLRDIRGNPWRPVTLPKCQRCDGDGEAHGSDRPFEWTPEVGYPGKCPICKGSKYNVSWLTPIVRQLAEAAYTGLVCERCKWPGTEIREGHDAVQAVIDWRKAKKDCPACHDTGRLDTGTLDPDRLLILADALEEADCPPDHEIVMHLRLATEAYTEQVRSTENCPQCGKGGRWRSGVGFEHEKICWHGDHKGHSLSWEPGETVTVKRTRPVVHACGCWVIELLRPQPAQWRAPEATKFPVG